jgi:hypothetical protein
MIEFPCRRSARKFHMNPEGTRKFGPMTYMIRRGSVIGGTDSKNTARWRRGRCFGAHKSPINKRFRLSGEKARG